MQKHHSQPRSDLRLFTPSLCTSNATRCWLVSVTCCLYLCFVAVARMMSCVDTEITCSAAVQLKELLQGPYRTLEAFRTEGKSTVSLLSCKLRLLFDALGALDTVLSSYSSSISDKAKATQTSQTVCNKGLQPSSMHVKVGIWQSPQSGRSCVCCW